MSASLQAESDVVTAPRKGRRRAFTALTKKDKMWLTIMVGIPASIHILLVWIPAFAGGKLTVVGKTLHDLFADNRFESDYFTLGAAWKF